MYTRIEPGMELKVHGLPAIVQSFHPNLRNIKIETHEGVSVDLPMSEFNQLYTDGALELGASNSPTMHSALHGMRDMNFHLLLKRGQIELIERRMGYVRCVMTEHETWNKSQEERIEAVEKYAIEIGDDRAPSESTVYRWYKKYKLFRGDPTALLPKHERKGNRGLKIDEKVDEAVNFVINKFYMKDNKHNARHIFEYILQPMFLDDGSLSGFKCPSYKSLLKRINASTVYKKMSNRDGYHKASSKYTKGTLVHKAEFLLDRVEIDHTPLDVQIVDSDGNVLGRPNLTFLIDCYTRMIVGFFLSVGPVDRRSVLKAILHAILPKDYIRKKYPELKNEWPCMGKFAQLVSDNGMDLVALQVKATTDYLGIVSIQHPAKKPNRKGTVERLFGTLNTKLVHNLPGTTFSNYQKKGEYKSELEACLTFEELDRVLHHWIVDVYHATEHRGLKDTPLNVWKRSINQYKAPMLPSNISTFKSVLLEPVQRSLQSYGVELNCLKYNSPELANLAKVVGHKFRVDVFYDPDDISVVTVFDPRKKELIEAVTPYYAYVKDGISLAEHKLHMENLRKAGYKEKEVTETMLIKARRDLLKIVKAAAAKNTTGKKSTRHKNDKERRKVSTDVNGSLEQMEVKKEKVIQDDEIRQQFVLKPTNFD